MVTNIELLADAISRKTAALQIFPKTDPVKVITGINIGTNRP